MSRELNRRSIADFRRLALRLVTACVATSGVSAETPSLQLGPLTVHPTNPRYFAASDGRAVWRTGSHTWATLQERGVEDETPDFDYAQYLDFMQKHGHNFLRMWVGEHARWWNTTRDAMGAARRLSEQLDLANMRPLPNLASSGFCLADPGETYVVFHGGYDSLTVHTGPGNWHAAWLDPITGLDVSRQKVVVTAKSLEVKPPNAGSWVSLVRAVRH